MEISPEEGEEEHDFREEEEEEAELYAVLDSLGVRTAFAFTDDISPPLE